MQLFQLGQRRRMPLHVLFDDGVHLGLAVAELVGDQSRLEEATEIRCVRSFVRSFVRRVRNRRRTNATPPPLTERLLQMVAHGLCAREFLSTMFLAHLHVFAHVSRSARVSLDKKTNAYDLRHFSRLRMEDLFLGLFFLLFGAFHLQVQSCVDH